MPTAPKLKVEPADKPAPKVKPEVKPDAHLLKLYDLYKNRDSVAGKSFINIVRHVKDNNLSRNVVRVTLESKGLSPGSVNSEVSRIMRATDPELEDKLDQVEIGELTVSDLRKTMVKKQKPIPTTDELVDGYLTKAAKTAFSSTEWSLAQFTESASAAWIAIRDTQQSNGHSENGDPDDSGAPEE